MPRKSKAALEALKSEITPSKTCPGCGADFPAGGRGMGKSFCADKRRLAFHAAHRSEGVSLIPLVKAWHATRHAKVGTREAAICRFARNQITEISRTLLDQDKEAGRDAVAYAGSLMDSGLLWCDRRR